MPPPLRYFIVRPGVGSQLGPIVPLIPADELPEWIDIVGAPRELSVEQTMSLTNLGTVAKSDDSFPVQIDSSAIDLLLLQQQQQQHQQPGRVESWADDVSDTSTVHPADKMKAHWTEPPHRGLGSSIHNRPDGGARQGEGAPTPAAASARQPASPPASPPSAVSVPVTTQHHQPPPTVPVPVMTHHHQPPAPAPARIPAQTRKSEEYCRHWCQHGTCKFGKECRYQHKMPASMHGLVEVGLCQLPQWWLQGGGGHHRQQAGAATAQQQQQQQFYHPGPAPAPAGTLLPAAAGADLYDALRNAGLPLPSPPSSPPSSSSSAFRGPTMMYQNRPTHHARVHHVHGGGGGMMTPNGPVLSNKKIKARSRDIVGWLKEQGYNTGPTGPLAKIIAQLLGGQGQGGDGATVSSGAGVVAQTTTASTQVQVAAAAAAPPPPAVVLEEEMRLLDL